jgi:hypothetical protein
VPERPFRFANVYQYSPPDHAVVLGHCQEGELLVSKGYVIFTEDIRDETGLGAISVPDAGLLREPDVSPSVTAAVQSGAMSLIF